ncbi:MAG: hypothetical protein Q9206_001072 [Seirophora lacunosa]|nr:MAG: hypothetical protein LQ344_001499 [Seirophora lacunosa]
MYPYSTPTRPFAFARFPPCIYLCLSLSLRVIAWAAEGETTTHEDHNHHRLHGVFNQDNRYHAVAVGASTYEPAFAGSDGSIIGRAPDAVTVTALGNNAPKQKNIRPGAIQNWTFSRETLQGPPGPFNWTFPLDYTANNHTRLETDLISLGRPPSTPTPDRTVWLTISTCDQPTSGDAANPAAPPPLEVYVSRSQRNQRPDEGDSDQVIVQDGGHGTLTLSGVTDAIWIGVRAPETDGFIGEFSYEIAASIDAPYATYFEGGPGNQSDLQITPWDTDTHSSILGTGDITNASSDSPNFANWLSSSPPPFNVYVYDHADPVFMGLHRSVCALRKRARIQSNKSMVKIGGQPRQLFYVTDLQRGSSYDAVMTLEPSSSTSTVRGGGAVWNATTFITKSDGNCRIIHSLPFCTDVAYAVPSNLNTSMTELALTYDTYANESYQNFSKSLQQIPCDMPPSAQYSLARNCSDCDNAYKAWLCAVTIPRCADLSSPSYLTHLIPRNINASTFANGSSVPEEAKDSLFSRENKTTNYYGVSRNPMIDEKIKPGPYKEMLPCKDLCYHLMQNCPAALQFACPVEGRGLNYSYGHYTVGETAWSCNWPGRKSVNAAGSKRFGWGLTGLILVAALYAS